jgi:hypothetical protein
LTPLRAVLVAGALFTLVGGVDSTASVADRSATGTRRPRDFTPGAVSACLRRASLSSPGVVLITTNPYIASRLRARAVVQYTLMQTDYGLPGVSIAFAKNRAATERLRRVAVAFIRREGLGDPRSVQRRRNVVFWHEKSTLPELVRAASGCL